MLYCPGLHYLKSSTLNQHCWASGTAGRDSTFFASYAKCGIFLSIPSSHYTELSGPTQTTGWAPPADHIKMYSSSNISFPQEVSHPGLMLLSFSWKLCGELLLSMFQYHIYKIDHFTKRHRKITWGDMFCYFWPLFCMHCTGYVLIGIGRERG